MTKRKIIQLNRKWHRYLGLLLGIQFFFWTLGGLYFSWTNIEEIRGDHLKTEPSSIILNDTLRSPSVFLKEHLNVDEMVKTLELDMLFGEPIYRVSTADMDQSKTYLFNAKNGKRILPLNKEQSIQLATEKLNIKATVENTEYLMEAGKHHEYRGRPLPAYAVTFSEPANTTIYVSTVHANVQTFRSNSWRMFDFLWMLHTMDYQERDNFNNLLLRVFSLFGLITILSGFSLYILTSNTSILKKKK